jgi:hypothetical protein
MFIVNVSLNLRPSFVRLPLLKKIKTTFFKCTH